MACPGQNPAEYSEENVQVFALWSAPIRLRPAMYIGDVTSRGLNHLLLELIGSSLSEAAAGHGRSVRVTLCADGAAEISDDGRQPPTVEEVFVGVGYSPHGYQTEQSTRNNFFYSIANALAERLTVFVRGDRSVYQHSFRAGEFHAAVQSGGPPGDRGLTVRFLPDPQIFGGAGFDSNAIRSRLRLCAFAHSGVRITFTDETTGTRDEFEHIDGIRQYVQALNEDRNPLHPDVTMLRGEEEGVRYDVGLQWCAEEEESGMSFVNGTPTPNGGTHTNGVRAGVRRGLSDFIREHVPQSGEFQGDDLRAGLTAVVSVWLREPTFEGALRTRLNNPELEAVLTNAVQRGVREYFEANADAAKRVVNAVVAARDLRVRARAAREEIRKARPGE